MEKTMWRVIQVAKLLGMDPEEVKPGHPSWNLVNELAQKVDTALCLDVEWSQQVFLCSIGK
jgi:hypothetical protein